MIINAFILAFRQLNRNYLRSFLTMLGIIIGTSSVVVMISLGQGMSLEIRNSIASLGSNLIMIYPSRSLDSSGKSLRRLFNMQEINELEGRIYGIKALAPLGSSSVMLQYKHNSRDSEVLGVDSKYFEVGNWEIENGRFFLNEEYKNGSNVCIIGSSIKNALFNEDPLGNRIRISRNNGSIICECIGVLKEKSQNIGYDQNEIILLPLKSYLRTIGKDRESINNINQIMISLEDGVSSALKVKEIDAALKDIRKSSSFEIMDTKQFEETMTSTIKTLTLFIGAIAGVSLIVGGIGIMNIMLVSITERTKEIGTRLAIGALEGEVLLQFLIESIVISASGGLIGIALSFGVSYLLALIMNLPFVYSFFVAFCVFLLSVVLGIIFGYIPSKKASKLNPIDALRHE